MNPDEKEEEFQYLWLAQEKRIRFVVVVSFILSCQIFPSSACQCEDLQLFCFIFTIFKNKFLQTRSDIGIFINFLFFTFFFKNETSLENNPLQ